MTRFRRALAAMLLVAFGLAAAAAAQSTGRVAGVVSDESGGVLPGVTVTVAGPDGRPLGVVTTDDVGAYAMAAPAGRVRVTFSLEGFASKSVDVVVAAGADTAIPTTTRLALAPQSETVVVRGAAPSPPAPVAPAPVAVPVEPHDRDSICGPAKADAAPESLGIVQALRHESGRELYATDDEVTIDGGTLSGLSVGRNVVARRTFRVGLQPDAPVGEHTAGVLQVVAASDRTAVAVVIYACDEIRRGDRLASFAPEPVRAPEPYGTPAFDRAVQILFGDADQLIGAPGRFMVIGRGSEALRVGERVTLFRRARRSRGTPVVLGDAIVVALRSDAATIRVQRAVDLIEPGDWAAPQVANRLQCSTCPVTREVEMRKEDRIRQQGQQTPDKQTGQPQQPQQPSREQVTGRAPADKPNQQPHRPGELPIPD